MKQYFKYFKCLLLICLPFISNAQTNSYKQDSLRLAASAYKTLHAELSDSDFKKLSWQNIMVDTLPGDAGAALKSMQIVLEPVLKIPAKDDTGRFILYSEQKNEKYYNWVLLSLSKDSVYYSGNIETYTVKNQLINSWKLKKNRVVESNGKSYKNFNTDSIPSVMLMMTDTRDSSQLLALSINQLLFNGKLKQDDPLSYAFCFLQHNFIYLFPFFNGYETISSGPIPIEETVPADN